MKTVIRQRVRDGRGGRKIPESLGIEVVLGEEKESNIVFKGHL